VSSPRRFLWAAVALVAVATPPLAAQRYVARRPSAFYFTGGIGGGTFTPVCDTGCFGDALNANNVLLVVGWALSPRLRVEGGWQYQGAVGDAGQGSHVASLTVGVAAYPVGNLFFRGGVSQLNLSVVDSVGVTEGKGGPAFTVGVGYDLFLSRTFAITPYANYFRGTLKNLSYSTVSTITTSGTVSALNGGISFTYRGLRMRP